MSPPGFAFISEPSLETRGSRARYLLQAHAKSIVCKRSSERRKAPTQSLSTAKLYSRPSKHFYAAACCGCGNCKPTATSSGDSNQCQRWNALYKAISLRQSSSELRSLQFYRERTSAEWSGWYDIPFWQELVPAIAQECEAVNYALTALATAHEGLEGDDADLQRLCLVQAGKSMGWMDKHQHDFSWSVWVTHCILLAELTSLVNPRFYFRCLRVLFDILQSMKRDEHHLRPLLERICSQHCQQLDPFPSLRRWPPAEPQPILSIPEFRTLLEARDYLEKVLNTLLFQIRNRVCVARCLLSWWLKRFLQLEGRCDSLGWKILRAAYGMSIVQINTFNSNYETDFDQYLEIFSQVADVYESVLHTDDKKVHYRFNIDTGLTCLAAWAAKWCREPSIRTRLISLLQSKPRNEGIYSSKTWSSVLEVVRALEEDGIDPRAVSCLEIPEEKRIRLHSLHMDLESSMLRLEVLYHPYTTSPRTVWIPFSPTGCVHFSSHISGQSADSFCSEIIQGTADLSFLETRVATKYHVLHSSAFFFTLPRW